MFTLLSVCSRSQQTCDWTKKTRVKRDNTSLLVFCTAVAAKSLQRCMQLEPGVDRDANGFSKTNFIQKVQDVKMTLISSK